MINFPYIKANAYKPVLMDFTQNKGFVLFVLQDAKIVMDITHVQHAKKD
jgi:hypothetical protein